MRRITPQHSETETINLGILKWLISNDTKYLVRETLLRKPFYEVSQENLNLAIFREIILPCMLNVLQTVKGQKFKKAGCR